MAWGRGGGQRGVEVGKNFKGKRTFLRATDVSIYLDCGDGFAGTYIGQNLPSCVLYMYAAPCMSVLSQ